MSFTSWLRNLQSFGRLSTTTRKGRRAARCAPAKRRRRSAFRPCLDILEDRVVPAGYLVTPQLQVLPTDNVGGTGPAQQVVFFESSVADYQALRQGVAAGTDAVVLDAGGDGLREMAAFLAGRHDLAAVHVVAHGASGALALGTATLDTATLPAYAAELAALGTALRPAGDLMLWSCNVAAGSPGQTFVQELARGTGAVVAAASHPVGARAAGGSWTLDTALGSVLAAAPFSAAARDAFQEVLWSPAASMSTARYAHTATLLSNGKVLVTGGSNGTSYLSSAELYNPATNTWSAAASMSTARYLHTPVETAIRTDVGHNQCWRADSSS